VEIEAAGFQLCLDQLSQQQCVARGRVPEPLDQMTVDRAVERSGENPLNSFPAQRADLYPLGMAGIPKVDERVR
jgi:hypothetical protein